MGKNKKILLISHELTRTGAPIVLLKVASILKELGYEVDLYTYRLGDLEGEFENLGIKVTEVRNRYRTLFYLAKKYIQSYKLVICNTVVTYKAVDIFQRFNVPLIWYLHESSRFLKQFTDCDDEVEPVLKNFYNIYAVSDLSKKSISEFGNMNCRIINNGVDDFFEGFSKTQDTIKFGFIGTITKEKGADVLVDAFLNLQKEYDNVQLIIAGNYETKFASKLKNSVDSVKSIQWLGTVKDKNKKNFFSNIDVLCIPSLEESASLVLLEAASAGLAIITTERNGACNIIKNQSDSIIIPTNESCNLYNAMCKLVNNPSSIDSMKKAMRNNYLSSSTIEHFKKNVLKMVQDNLDNYPIVKTPLHLEKFKIFQKIKTISGVKEYYLFERKIFSVK